MNKQELLDDLNLIMNTYSNESSFESGVITGLATAIVKIGKLDEPEVLSQEWIDENKKDSGVHYIGYYVPIGRLQNLLVPKQELPVIPKYVADWIEEVKASGDSLDDAYALLRDIYYRSEVADWMAEDKKNSETFARAWLDGYTVAEEPLYYALVKGHELTDSYDVYWNCDKSDSSLFISKLHHMITFSLTEMSKEDWGKLGINDSNADFVRVEVEE